MTGGTVVVLGKTRRNCCMHVKTCETVACIPKQREVSLEMMLLSKVPVQGFVLAFSFLFEVEVEGSQILAAKERDTGGEV